MEYIVHKRYKGNYVDGTVNIPAMTKCQCDGKVIFYNGKAICSVSSDVAHQFFAVDNDGMGMVRGRLTQSIQNTLAKRDKYYQERWDKIWADSVCQPYKRKDYDDYWLWGDDFFAAEIGVLRHIAKLIGAKEGA